MTARRAVRLVLAVGTLLGAGAPAAWAQSDAPATADAVRVSVGADIMLDPAAGLYTYRYRVTNDRSSAAAVGEFAVASGPRVANVTAPSGWTSRLDPERGIVLWASGTSEADTIKPGDTVTGFSFESPDPPAPAPFHASGVASPPHAGQSERGEEGDGEADGTTLAPRQAPVTPGQRLTVYSAPRG